MEVLRVILGTVFIVGIIVLVVLLTMMAHSSHKINELEKLKKMMAENPNYYKDKEFLRKIKKYIDVRFEKTAKKNSKDR